MFKPCYNLNNLGVEHLSRLDYPVVQTLLPFKICKKNGPLLLQELRISLGQE